MTRDKTIHCLNSLLRGEIAATETYEQVVDTVRNTPGERELRMIHAEHREAANELRKRVHFHGGLPDQSSGVWGAFAKAVEGTAKFFGTTAALTALKEGEEEGMSSYEEALKDAPLPAECRTLITTMLMPRCRMHARILDRLMNTATSA